MKILQKNKILIKRSRTKEQEKINKIYVNHQETLKHASFKPLYDIISYQQLLIVNMILILPFIFPHQIIIIQNSNFRFINLIYLQHIIISFMARFRTYQQFDFKNPNFIGVSLALLIVYYLYAYQSVILEGKYFITPWLIITTVLFVIAMWSYIMVVITNPGEVPVYWGLYNKQIEERKYCLICHNFKPQRCHHCSKCKKCVLNMDHHCPWINNCVGFNNRKYFVLFLIYLSIAMILAAIQVSIIEYNQIKQISQGNRNINIHTILRMTGLIFLLVMVIPVLMFTLMHIRMILQNVTTLEEMIQQKKKNNKDIKFDQKYQFNKYDIGSWYNFSQVFGQNIFLWFLPIQDDKPLKGKGWSWLKRNGRQSFNRDQMYDFQR